MLIYLALNKKNHFITLLYACNSEGKNHLWAANNYDENDKKMFQSFLPYTKASYLTEIDKIKNEVNRIEREQMMCLSIKIEMLFCRAE